VAALQTVHFKCGIAPVPGTAGGAREVAVMAARKPAAGEVANVGVKP
jgi:hypothetical protein